MEVILGGKETGNPKLCLKLGKWSAGAAEDERG